MGTTADSDGDGLTDGEEVHEYGTDPNDMDTDGGGLTDDVDGAEYLRRLGGRGPFAIRIGGTSDFVSDIDPDWPLAWPPGRVQTVTGWGRPEVLLFDSLDAAIAAALQVGDIEGFHTSVEPVGW